MLEYEKKVMLTAEEYILIVLLMCKHTSLQIQTNYYFDNEEFAMNKKGITCRIRAKDKRYKATVKKHNTEHPDCSIEVDFGTKEWFDTQIFNVFGLNYQGELVTERIILHKDADCEMVLDRNIYLGNTDFELEVEYCERSELKAQQLIRNIAKCLVLNGPLTSEKEFLSRVGSGKCKSQRFFECLKKVKLGDDKKCNRF